MVIASHTQPSQHIASHRITPHIASHRITPHHTASHRITPHHTASHRIPPHHTTSHRIESLRITQNRRNQGGFVRSPKIVCWVWIRPVMSFTNTIQKIRLLVCLLRLRTRQAILCTARNKDDAQDDKRPIPSSQLKEYTTLRTIKMLSWSSKRPIKY
jgi:hypothetical protein